MQDDDEDVDFNADELKGSGMHIVGDESVEGDAETDVDGVEEKRDDEEEDGDEESDY